RRSLDTAGFFASGSASDSARGSLEASFLASIRFASCRRPGVASQQRLAPCHHRCCAGNFARASACVMQEGEEIAGDDANANALAAKNIATRIWPLHLEQRPPPNCPAL